MIRGSSNVLRGRASATDTTTTELIATQGAAVKIHLTDVSISNSSAATFAEVHIKDGSTTIWTFPVPGSGGVTHRFATPLVLTANTALNFAASSGVTTITVSAAGYKGE
jgi:hypothetical protein